MGAISVPLPTTLKKKYGAARSNTARSGTARSGTRGLLEAVKSLLEALSEAVQEALLEGLLEAQIYGQMLPAAARIGSC